MDVKHQYLDTLTFGKDGGNKIIIRHCRQNTREFHLKYTANNPGRGISRLRQQQEIEVPT